MSSQLLINVMPFETRVALFENGMVTEVLIERSADQGLVGNIYLGKVQRVLPGMQAAFVELGLDKAAFLYVGDVIPLEAPEEDEDPEKAIEEKSRKRPQARIEDLLTAGQSILVQVTKDPISTKGPRVSCNIALPGRHIVFLATYDHVGISRKVTDETERERLKAILQSQKPDGCGFVARTVAQGVSDEKLQADCAFLVSMWQEIVKRSSELKAPYLVQPELDVIFKCARDISNDHIDKIVVDDHEAFGRLDKFLQIFDNRLLSKLELYDGSTPLFEKYGVEGEISRSMNRKVWLRSGGYLVIDQAEALTVIDVNTGRFVGKRNLEDTILRTNMEAVREVAYQLRLRNIGGVVIVDFIDMESQEDRDRVLSALLDALKKDRARCNVIKISELGLVEMTRQRTRESLERQLCEPCFYCDGRGMLKSKRTIAYEIFRSARVKGPFLSEPSVVIHAHPEVVDFIYAEEHEMLSHIETEVGKSIAIRPRGSFHQEQFDIFGSQHSAKESQKLLEPESSES